MISTLRLYLFCAGIALAVLIRRVRAEWSGLLIAVLVVLFLLSVAIFGDQPETALGSFPVPRVVSLMGWGAPLPRISLGVRPRVMSTPGDITISVWIPPNPENARFAVSWESTGGKTGGVTRQLDGATSPLTQDPIVLRGYPSARYVIAAALYDRRGRIREQTSTTIEAPE